MNAASQTGPHGPLDIVDISQAAAYRKLGSKRLDFQMFRRTFHRLAAHRERCLALLLMPVVLLGTLPHTACICSDGHFEPLCHKIVGSWQITSGGDCSRSLNRTAGEVPSCCQAKQPGTLPGGSSAGLTASGCCCHPFTVAPAPAMAAVKAKVESQRASYAAVPISVAAVSFSTDCEPFAPADFFGPPLDLVVVFQRLTI